MHICAKLDPLYLKLVIKNFLIWNGICCKIATLNKARIAEEMLIYCLKYVFTHPQCPDGTQAAAQHKSQFLCGIIEVK